MSLDVLLDKVRTEFVLDRTVDVRQDTELLLSGLLDSLAVVNLVAWIEDEMGTTIDPVEVVFENFETVGSIHKLVQTMNR